MQAPIDDEAPTPPPVLPPRQVVASLCLLSPPALPPEVFRRHVAASLLQRKLAAADAAEHKRRQSQPLFIPCFFFYGSLMDPEVLQTILQLREIPIMNKESIFGFAVKMWGIYPTLLPSVGGKVFGTIWEVGELKQFVRLAEYETEVYIWCHCDINGERLRDCRTFYWAEDRNGDELQEGNLVVRRSASGI